MQKIDISEAKNALRRIVKEYRKSLEIKEKNVLDTRIFENLFSIDCFLDCETVLCYMSNNLEIDTNNIILKLFNQNKTVAVPKCIKGTRDMQFFVINSFKQTEKCSFGIFEPLDKECQKLNNLKNSVCIMPGLAFDKNGYRLGYGKGYYDRFLDKFDGIKIGLCYEKYLLNEIAHDFYDIKADIVVTENQILYIKKTGKW